MFLSLCHYTTAVDGEAAVAANAAALANEIEGYARETGREVVLVGHSKGGLDAAAALAMHERRLATIVRGLITVRRCRLTSG